MADAGEHGEPAVRRDQLLAGLTGRVVEIGAGSGTNFAHYPDTVTGVVAVEPEPYLRTWAEAAAERAPVPVSVVDGTADALPLTPASVDAGVVSLVLCSVPDQAAALKETAAIAAAWRDEFVNRQIVLMRDPMTVELARAIEATGAVPQQKESISSFVGVRYSIAVEGDDAGRRDAFLGVRQTGPRTIWCSTTASARRDEVEAAMTVCRSLSWEG